MRIIAFFLIITFIVSPLCSADTSYEDDMQSDISACEAVVGSYDDQIKVVQDKIDEKTAWMQNHIIITRAQGSSLGYVQNVSTEGHKEINLMEEEKAALEEKRNLKNEACDNLKSEWEDYLARKNVHEQVSQGLNPCNEGYFPNNGKCIAEQFLCIDTVNGYYDWEDQKCRCNPGYEWRKRRCRIIEVVADSAITIDDAQEVSFIGSKEFFYTNIESIVADGPIGYSEFFQKVLDFKIRLKEIAGNEKTLMQFFITNRDIRKLVKNYKVEIFKNNDMMVSKYIEKGNMIYSFVTGESYRVNISAFDSSDSLLKEITFDVQN